MIILCNDVISALLGRNILNDWTHRFPVQKKAGLPRFIHVLNEGFLYMNIKLYGIKKTQLIKKQKVSMWYM